MRIKENEIIPRWYGVAWRDFWLGEAVVLPIGIHWIAGVARHVWWEFRRGYRGEPSIEHDVREAYQRGYEQGRRDGIADELLGINDDLRVSR